MCLVILKWLGIVHGHYKWHGLLAIFASGAPTVYCRIQFAIISWVILMYIDCYLYPAMPYNDRWFRTWFEESRKVFASLSHHLCYSQIVNAQIVDATCLLLSIVSIYKFYNISYYIASYIIEQYTMMDGVRTQASHRCCHRPSP